MTNRDSTDTRIREAQQQLQLLGDLLNVEYDYTRLHDKTLTESASKSFLKQLKKYRAEPGKHTE